MIVCVCAKVSERQIHQAVASGAQSLECLQFELGVAVQCGRCSDCASRVLCDAKAGARNPGYQHTAMIGLQPQLA